MCLRKVRDLSRVTPRSLILSTKPIVEPATLTEEMSARVRLRCDAPRRIASDLSGLSAR